MKRSITLYNTAMVLLAMATLAATLIAIIPSWRAAIRFWFHGDERKILSFADGDLKNDGKNLRVYKIKTNEGLFLEIYELTETGFSGFHVGTIKLPDLKDGYFNFMGKPTNLALSDVDSDSIIEIIAPSYDENLIARLNVYHFNKTTEKFERITPQQLGFK
ncbi:MAG: hypothetical protein AB7O96_04695 [Pseudobdellovibrionaceae bacterium]